MFGFSGLAQNPQSLFGKLPLGGVLGSSPDLEAIKSEQGNLLGKIGDLKSNISGKIGEITVTGNGNVIKQLKEIFAVNK